jgi:type VI secretion system protein ImpK
MIKTRLSKPRDLTVEGRGEANPVAPNTTPEGRAANRRIEIDLTRQEGGA